MVSQAGSKNTDNIITNKQRSMAWFPALRNGVREKVKGADCQMTFELSRIHQNCKRKLIKVQAKKAGTEIAVQARM
ncbi:hypothetical protein [Desulfobacca acetoxidans]